MPENEVSITISANSRRLNSELSRSSSRLRSFSRRTVNLFRGAGRTIGKLFGGVGLLGGAYGILKGAKNLLSLETRLRQLAVQSNRSMEEMEGLKKRLFELADAARDEKGVLNEMFTGQTPEALLSGIEAIVERTGDFDFAVAAIEDMGKVATATGAEMSAVGATASNLMEKMGIKPEGILTVFDILAAQGKEGAFTLQNMSTLFERLLSTATMVGVEGETGIRKFGAFLQIAKRGFGAPERAATGIESVIASIVEKASLMPKIVFELDEAGMQKFRDFDLILKDIVTLTVAMGEERGTATRLKLFGREGIKAINPLVQSFKEFGDFREFDRLVELGGDGVALTKDFGTMVEDTSQKIESLGTKIYKVLNEILTTERIEKFGDAIDSLIELIEKLNKMGVGGFLLGPEKPIEPTMLGPTVIPEWNPIWERSPFLSNLLGLGEERTAPMFDLLPTHTAPQPEHVINVDINIDQERVTTKTDNMGTKVKAKLNRGKF